VREVDDNELREAEAAVVAVAAAVVGVIFDHVISGPIHQSKHVALLPIPLTSTVFAIQVPS
jgi:hypothetical protein